MQGMRARLTTEALVPEEELSSLFLADRRIEYVCFPGFGFSFLFDNSGWLWTRRKKTENSSPSPVLATSVKEPCSSTKSCVCL